MMSRQKISRALLSVSDKTGLLDLAQNLTDRGVEILASGGTGDALSKANIPFVRVEEFTGNPEAFDGRMKTLSFKLESAILFDRLNQSHLEEARNLGIPPIDLIVCNFYPFEKVWLEKSKSAKSTLWEEMVHHIDVGGPTMVRAAAKNFHSVCAIVNPKDYAKLIEEMRYNEGATTLEFRKYLMLKAFEHVNQYDRAIIDAFQQLQGWSSESARDLQPEKILPRGLAKELRYGENPHQKAFFVKNETSNSTEAIDWTLFDGKGLELSYNNIVDGTSAFGAMKDAFLLSRSLGQSHASVCIVKHKNPCGLACAPTLSEAFDLAWEGDPKSAFGGVIAMSHSLDLVTAQKFDTKFVELILAPGFDQDALEFLRKKKKNLRLIPLREECWQTSQTPPVVSRIEGGWLWQQADTHLDVEFHLATKANFSTDREQAARFGVVAAKWIQSNAIALVRSTASGGFQLVGMGSGQPNRIDALKRLAWPKAQEGNACDAGDLVLASDAFFPFADTIEEAQKCGIRFIVQPGGSVRDHEVIEACDRNGIAMLLTGKRHFRH